MTQAEFESLVRKLEEEANHHPQDYRNKVLLWTLLGYGYILIMFLLFLGLLGLSLALLIGGHVSGGGIKLLILSGSLCFFIAKALYVRFEMPEGIPITERDAPALFAMLHELEQRMKTPKIDVVLLNDEFNASIAQIPRLGILGWNRSVLMLGLPLMLSLSSEQFKSVLAHELGHLSKADTRFGAWIYRVRMTWRRLLTSLIENEQFGTGLFRKFFMWYFPRFDAYTFVMGRQEEYVADRHAAEATSPQIAAEALIHIHIKGAYYHKEFGDTLRRHAAESGSVPTPLWWYFGQIRQLSYQRQAEILTACLKEETGVEDTHPCLRDRLHALGVQPFLPSAPTQTAAMALIPDALGWMKRFDDQWASKNGEKIRGYIQAMGEYRQLREKPNKTIEEYHEAAAMAYNLYDAKEAIPVLKECIARFGETKETAKCLMVLGRLCLETDDEAQGIFWVEKALHLDEEIRMDCFKLLTAYYAQSGNEAKFEETKRRADAWMEQQQQRKKIPS